MQVVRVGVKSVHEPPLSGHVVCKSHIHLVKHLIFLVLVGTQEVVVATPESHVKVSTVVVIITATDPLGRFEGSVKSFNPLLVKAKSFDYFILILKYDVPFENT